MDEARYLEQTDQGTEEQPDDGKRYKVRAILFYEEVGKEDPRLAEALRLIEETAAWLPAGWRLPMAGVGSVQTQFLYGFLAPLLGLGMQVAIPEENNPDRKEFLQQLMAALPKPASRELIEQWAAGNQGPSA